MPISLSEPIRRLSQEEFGELSFEVMRHVFAIQNDLEIAVRGTPDEVKDETLEILEAVNGEGIILSVGGGVSPGMPRENVLAMLEALDEFNVKRAASLTAAR